MDPQRRVRRNLVIFGLVLLGNPMLLVVSCVAFGFKPCCTDIVMPTPTLGA